MIDGVIVTPLKVINVAGGNVFHAMKISDAGYTGFGEAYFSTVEPGTIKAWKRHHEMTLNLVVPVGKIKFVMFDSQNCNSMQFQEVVLSKNNYCRLTIPPMVWMGFQGVDSGCSMLLNIANIPHQPTESDRKDLKEIEYDWSNN